MKNKINLFHFIKKSSIIYYNNNIILLYYCMFFYYSIKQSVYKNTLAILKKVPRNYLF